MSGTPELTRRDLLLAAAGTAAASGALATIPGATTGQSDASITFDDQESNGETVVVASASTPVDARLLIVTGTSTVYRTLELDAGTEFTDRTVELTTAIERSQQVRAELRTADGNDEFLAGDAALIAVGESLAEARSTVTLPNGEGEIIEADPDAGFSHPYLLYRPDTVPESAQPLFVLPHNSRSVSTQTDLLGQVREAALGSLFEPADTLGLPGLIPAFPRPPNDGGDLIQSLALPDVESTYASDGSENSLDELATEAFPAESLERVDEQLLSMVDDATDRLADDGYALTERMHMTGFSASAQFSARFAFLYPDRVAAITVGGNGAYPLPEASRDGTALPYPLGTADYRTITGEAFDETAWTAIRQFVYVGADDQPLPEDDSSGYYSISREYEDTAVDIFGENRVTERLPVTQSAYEDAGADATFETYDGVGHTITEDMRADVLEFHREASTDATTPVTDDATTPTRTQSPGTDEQATATAGRRRTQSAATSPAPERTTGSGGPGFGVGTALASLVGAGYLLRSRTDDSE